MHAAWEATQNLKHDRARSKEFENEIERLKARIIHKEAVEAALLQRISQLEHERDYWKVACEGVYVN